MQCCNAHGTIRYTSRKKFPSLPVPRLPHPDVSTGIPLRALVHALILSKGSYRQTPCGIWPLPSTVRISPAHYIFFQANWEPQNAVSGLPYSPESIVLTWRNTIVYMTLFRKYNAQQLKALEWKYHCMVRLIPVHAHSLAPKLGS